MPTSPGACGAPRGNPPVVKLIPCASGAHPERTMPGGGVVRRLAPILAALVLAACGGDDDAPDAEPALRAQESNVVTVDGIEYRVEVFRELNVRTPSDALFYKGAPPEEGSGLYAAFLTACNRGESTRRTTPALTLLDAFGERFPRKLPRERNQYAYTPAKLDPGECLPRSDRINPGVAAVYSVPFEDVGERPLLLEIAPRSGSGEAQLVELDL